MLKDLYKAKYQFLITLRYLINEGQEGGEGGGEGGQNKWRSWRFLINFNKRGAGGQNKRGIAKKSINIGNE